MVTESGRCPRETLVDAEPSGNLVILQPEALSVGFTAVAEALGGVKGAAANVGTGPAAGRGTAAALGAASSAALAASCGGASDWQASKKAATEITTHPPARRAARNTSRPS